VCVEAENSGWIITRSTFRLCTGAEPDAGAFRRRGRRLPDRRGVRGEFSRDPDRERCPTFFHRGNHELEFDQLLREM